ncbi:MAG TPA: NUMOD1 domain-containing DNA-binding protein [Puia sp.]|nr:NUMOD1 domain-containing DNA-binding protein [Puia sp.]
MPISKKIKKYPYHNKSLEDLPGERWKEIPYAEGYFMVSDLGRVKSLDRYIEQGIPVVGRWIKGKILSQAISKTPNHYKNDYSLGLMVTYTFDKKRNSAMVRRLVYEAFVQPTTKASMDGKFVYPIDGDGLNSNASNLALADKSELRKLHLAKDRYIPPAFVVDQVQNRKHLLKLNRKKRRVVKQYSLKGKLLNSFPSITVASRKTGVSISCISACANKNLFQTKGFVWRFNEDDYDGALQFREPVEKPVTQYDIKGKKIAVFPSMNEASRQTGISVQAIVGCAKKKYFHASGYVWRYAEEQYKGEYKQFYMSRRVAQYSLSGTRLACFDSISDAVRHTGCSYEGIRLTLKQKMHSSGGFSWKHEGKPFVLVPGYNAVKK